MSKPYFKLTVGKKPYTSSDVKFGLGRIRVEVSDAYPDAQKVAGDLFAMTWGDMCRKVLAFWDDHPNVPGHDVRLTEPADTTLRAEVARLDALKTARAAKAAPVRE